MCEMNPARMTHPDEWWDMRKRWRNAAPARGGAGDLQKP